MLLIGFTAPELKKNQSRGGENLSLKTKLKEGTRDFLGYVVNHVAFLCVRLGKLK
jgi:hypothetical protein